MAPLPLPSGKYTIANARFKNVLTLLNGNQSSDVVSGAWIDIPNAHWDIERLSNNNYMIKNIQYGSFINRGPNPQQGDSVFGGNKPQQWRITEMATKGQHVVYPLGAFVYWGLSDGESETPIQFSSTENDPKNQWIFAKVPDNKSSEGASRHDVIATEQEDWMVAPSDVEFGQKIGMGGFGAVFKGTWHKSPVALKVLMNNDGISPTSSAIRREIKIWSGLRHPHILLFLGANVQDDSPFIVMPLLNNGNARDYINRNPDCNRQKFLHQITLGLLYLHTRNIVHGDLKSVNVLIDDGENAVLCDFSLSRIKADLTSRTTKATLPAVTTGSRNWMSPERLMGGLPKKPSDIYAFGMVIYEIHTNEIPLGYIGYSEFVELIVHQNIRPQSPDSDEAPQMTDECWQLAGDCWQKDPSSRPTIDSVCNRMSQIASKIPVRRLTNLPAPAIDPPNLEKPPLSPPDPPQPAPAPIVELLPLKELPAPQSAVSRPAPRTFRKTGEFRGSTSLSLFVSLSPDGERMVTNSINYGIRVWNVRTRNAILGSSRGHSQCVRSVAYSPDGKQIVSGSDDRSVIIWNAHNGDLFKQLRKHIDRVKSVAFTPDGSMIASGSDDETIQIWDSRTGQNIHSLTCTGSVNALMFSPNGEYLVAGKTKGIVVWGVQNWKRVRTSGGYALAVAVSPDSQHVAHDQRMDVCIADMITGKSIMKLQGHTHRICCLAFSPDGTWVASGSDDRTIRIWDTATGNSILTLEFGSEVRSIAISPDGTKIVAACFGYDIFTCDSESVV